MKKLILLSIAFISISCDSEEQTKCNCNAWVRMEGIPIREVIPLELNCETNQPINLPEGYVFLGCDNENTP